MQETIRRNKMIRFIQLTLSGAKFNAVELYEHPGDDIIKLFNKINTSLIEKIVVSFSQHTKSPTMISKMFNIDYNRTRNLYYNSDACNFVKLNECINNNT